MLTVATKIMPYIINKGPPELMPVTRAAEIPNQEFVREKPTPSTDHIEKFLFMSCEYPIAASRIASMSIVSIWLHDEDKDVCGSRPSPTALGLEEIPMFVQVRADWDMFE